ncbi:MAG: DUF4349 domain-containing protein [Deltaproteobacteria bacterium]|nr:DUF4349 domain-containing protein [Deltaproteobacteria bacterium]
MTHHERTDRPGACEGDSLLRGRLRELFGPIGLLLGLMSACAGAASQVVGTTVANPEGRDLAYSAQVTLEVSDEADFEPTTLALAELAKSLGGYAETRTPSSIVLRVPTAKLDEALGKIGEKGEIAEKWISAEDVTDTKAELVVRAENLRKLEARLRELAAIGQTVTELLEVEKELARVSTELLVLEDKIRRLEQRVAFAIVSVSLSDAMSPGPVGWLFYGLFAGVRWLFVWG